MSNAVMTFKRVFVGNLDERVTAADIKKLFGLDLTPYLQKNSFVDIKADESRAEVIIPGENVDDILKYNGMTMYDKNIEVTSEQMSESVATSEDMETPLEPTTAPEEGEIIYMLLDVRNNPDLNFDPVKEVEVCAALHIDHADDPHKAVKMFRGNREGTFAIESTNMSRYVGTSLVIRGHSIPLTPFRKRPRGQQPENRVYAQPRRRRVDPDRLRIRIFDAWELRHRNLDDRLFDEYFKGLGAEIIESTQPETCREDREIFNTNRFLFVKKVKEDGSPIDFGNRITIAGHSFKLSYYGMQKYCVQCRRSHGWDCPTRVRNEFLRQLRKGKTDQVKIYADSTLRHVNQLGLSSDVACMSGGGIAQICNAIPYDEPHKEVIIKAGNNELKEESLQEFVYTVGKTAAKLQGLAETTPVTVVLPPTDTDTPEMAVKGKYLIESIAKVVKVVQLTPVDTDDTGHPTKNGTLDIVKQIHQNKNIILPDCEEDTVVEMKYRGVQTIFKVGCRGCDSMLHTRSLCNECKNAALDIDVGDIEKEIADLRQQMYPAITPSVEVSNKNKRGLNNESDDEVNVSTKAPRND